MAETATLKVGDEAPDFELPSSPSGDKFKLSDYRGKNAVVLNFVPLAFSGVCTSQLGLVEKMRGQFAAQGAIPVALSVDHSFSLQAWKKDLGADFPFLSDFQPRGATMEKYGVFMADRGIAKRTVIVVGKDGKVAWIQPTEKNTDMPDYDPVMACNMG